MFLSIANKKCNGNNTGPEGKTLFITRFDEQQSLRHTTVTLGFSLLQLSGT